MCVFFFRSHTDHPSKCNGFTLIEVIAVLVLLGILVTVAATKLTSSAYNFEVKSMDILRNDLAARIQQQYVESQMRGSGTATLTDYDQWADIGIGTTADLSKLFPDLEGTWAVNGGIIRYSLHNSGALTQATFTIQTDNDPAFPPDVRLTY